MRSPRSSLGGYSFAYLIRISSKYGVDLKGLLECFREAWREGASTYGNMIVQLRMKADGHMIFLVMREGEFVAQLRFDEKMLEEMRRLDDSALSSLIEAWRERRRGERRPETLKIKDLD